MVVLYDWLVLALCFGLAFLLRFYKGSRETLRVIFAVFTALLVSGFFLHLLTWRTGIFLIPMIVALLYKSVRIFPSPESSVRIPRVVFIALLAVGLVSLAAVIAFPTTKVSAPSGQYPVSTVSFMLTDPARPELYGTAETKGKPRRTMVQVWYPAADKHGKVAAWLPDREVHQALARFANFPDFLMSHLSAIKSNSLEGAPFLNPSNRYPVIIISHGWGGSRFIHTNLAEEYASHGFLVVAIDHTYGSLAVKFPDGFAAFRDNSALGDFDRDDHTNAFMQRANILEKTYMGDTEQLLNSMLEGNLAVELPTVAGSVSLNALIDKDRIGLLAHSTGAGAGYALTQTRPEIKAYIAMDAWMEPVEKTIAPSMAAVLHIGSTSWEKGPNAPLIEKTLQLSPISSSVRIQKSTHMDMAMIRYLTSIGALIQWSGTINARDYERALRNITLTWFTDILMQGDFNKAQADIAALKQSYPFY